MCILESLLLKTPQIWPIFDPTPTLTGVSNQKTSVLPVNTLKPILKKLYENGTDSVLFCVKRHQKTTKNTLIYRYRKRTIKSSMKSENNA